MKCITFNARLKYLIKFYFLLFILNRKAFSTLIYSRYFFFFFYYEIKNKYFLYKFINLTTHKI